MDVSLFHPYVTVTSDGMIDVEWNDSQVSTMDADDGHKEIEINEGHGLILDAALGGNMGQNDEPISSAERLRSLADYIDMKNGVPLGKPFEPLDLPDNIEAGRYDDLLVNIETACRNRRILMEADGIEVPWEGELPR